MSRRPYIRKVKRSWWLGHRRYVVYMVRELTSLFVGLYCAHGPCSGRKRMPSRSSAAALVSTRMRNCSAPLHAKPTSSAS
jgi:hypothetical protein